MISNSFFKDCKIAIIDGNVRAICTNYKDTDEKSKMEYYICRDIISGQDFIAFDISSIKNITCYMDKEELNKFTKDDLNINDKYNIIARAIKEEQNILNDIYYKEEQNAIKRLVRDSYPVDPTEIINR